MGSRSSLAKTHGLSPVLSMTGLTLSSDVRQARKTAFRTRSLPFSSPQVSPQRAQLAPTRPQAPHVQAASLQKLPYPL